MPVFSDAIRVQLRRANLLWRSRLGLVLLTLIGLANEGKADAKRYLNQPRDWFSGKEAREIAGNILSYQSELGGWPKNADTTARRLAGSRTDIKPTFDNGATTGELRFLARVFSATSNEFYRAAFNRGYDYILRAQYPTGGWPQSYPPPANSYHRHITFNDDAMVRLMEFLRESYTSPIYAFLDVQRQQAARRAFARGIECVLRCQIRVNGQLTVWCAQHDEQDCRPRPGRSYEVVSLSGSESVGMVRLLMSLEEPTEEVIRAVQGAIAWFESARLAGLRMDTVPDENAPRGRNRVVIKDPAAPPLWARFYEIGSNRPIFMDRDGVPRYSLAEIGYERRNGYAWYGNWAQRLLEVEYPIWRKKWATGSPVPSQRTSR